MENPEPGNRKPEWLKIRMASSHAWRKVAGSLQETRLHTICEEARCPNMSECWSRHGTASFLILGDTCTRRCRFCNVKTGLPPPPDPDEPRRLALAAAAMGLRHVVVTMVTRDDLRDGGAAMLAETVVELRKTLPEASIEILSSDLMGRPESIRTVLDTWPQVMSHNLETVRRLTPLVRSRSDYQRSLDFLRTCAGFAGQGSSGYPGRKMTVKSSLMLGLGEEFDEILQTLDDLRAHGVQVVNLGQYLQPTVHHIPVRRWWTPGDFDRLGEEARRRGFDHVESAPLVRSSYHAGAQYAAQGLPLDRSSGPRT